MEAINLGAFSYLQKPYEMERLLLDIRRALERKRMDETLRTRKEFSSSLLNKSPNPVLVINPDTSVRYVNPALEKLTGFSSAELIGRKAPYPWWTEETLQTSGDLEKVTSRGEERLEELFQRKDGKRFWVEVTSALIRSNGELNYNLANWVDITELKEAEEALQKTHEELERRVKERTAELLEANEELKREIRERKHAEKRVKNLELSALHRLFKQGKCYLIIEEKPDTSFKLFAKLIEYGFKGLLISRTHPSHVQGEYTMKDVPIVWLTYVQEEKCIIPTNIPQLSITVKDFAENEVEGVIMLEGLEYLIAQNGFEVTLRFTESLIDILSTSTCRLIMPFDALTLNEVELHRLEREVNAVNAKEVQVLILD